MFSMKNKSTRKVVHLALFAVIVLALVVTIVPQPVSASNLAQTKCAVKHTVVAGETLSTIALKYGVTVQEIIAVNDLDDPNMIFVGQVLCIPEGATTPPERPEDGDGSAPAGGPTFDVTFEEDNFIQIQTVGFPKQQSHIVRVSQLERLWIENEFEVIGRFRTDKSGGSDAYIRLTREYREVELVICLKNAFTDQILCDVFSPFED